MIKYQIGKEYINILESSSLLPENRSVNNPSAVKATVSGSFVFLR
jgi:hypothetical protein